MAAYLCILIWSSSCPGTHLLPSPASGFRVLTAGCSGLWERFMLFPSWPCTGCSLFLLPTVAPPPSKNPLLTPQNLIYRSLPNEKPSLTQCNQVNTYSLPNRSEVWISQGDYVLEILQYCTYSDQFIIHLKPHQEGKPHAKYSFHN